MVESSQPTNIKVRIIYRNYKPLHDLYASLTLEPPKDVTYEIPKPRPKLRYLYPLYHKFGDNWLARSVVMASQNILFDTQLGEEVDLIHYVQLVPDSVPQLPYVVDFEHVSSLANFLKIDAYAVQNIINFLGSSRCERIVPLSGAARRSLETLTQDETLARKMEVIYPALPNFCALFQKEVDHSFVRSRSGSLRLLFVGNSVYKKGLHELLTAFSHLEKMYQDIELYVVSDAPRRLVRKYSSDRTKFFPSNLSKDDIVKKFFLPCDLLVLPTHDDTFGMVLLFALSSGTPVVTTRQFAAAEIVNPGENGFFVHSERLHLEEIPFPNRETAKKYHTEEVEKRLVGDLVETIEYLYLRRDLVQSMSEQSAKDFEPGGKFSIGERNRKLRAIYHSSLAN
jgi:glycosyltransferase involved in cell wall biosynthesis